MDSEIGLSGKTVLVVGTGISGIAAVNLLATQSANIILLDGNTELSPETVAAKFSEDIHYDLILGDLPDQVMDRIDLAVLSPGVPTDLPFVVRRQAFQFGARSSLLMYVVKEKLLRSQEPMVRRQRQH